MSFTNKGVCDLKYGVLDFRLRLSFECIGVRTMRHPGRDCRDPEAMDGNIKSDHKLPGN